MNNLIKNILTFGSKELRVISCDDGLERVQLKPISDEIGLNWKTLNRKIAKGSYLHKRLGIKVAPPKGGDIDEQKGVKAYICIRIDKVEAFLNSLNPSMIRVNGNHSAADWLEAKHDEWDQVIHEYEKVGNVLRVHINQKFNALAKLDKIKDPILKAECAKEINADFGLNIPIGKQMGLDV